MGNWTDGGQLFYPAIWPAPFCQKGSTSKQPRQGAHECVQVPWAPFSNIFKAVPSIEMPWQWLIFDLWVKIYKLEFFWIFSSSGRVPNFESKIALLLEKDKFMSADGTASYFLHKKLSIYLKNCCVKYFC